MTVENIIEKALEEQVGRHGFCPYDYTNEADLGYIPPCERKKDDGESCWACVEMLIEQFKKEAVEEYRIKSVDDGR